MARTIIALDDNLHRRAKAYSARHGTTLTALIEEALRLRLARREPSGELPVRLPTFRGDGLQPGVNLDDMDNVLDRLDGLDIFGGRRTNN
jgi:hypothetical protein